MITRVPCSTGALPDGAPRRPRRGEAPRKLGEVLKGSYTYFAEDDIIIAKITPCMENGKCALARGLSNKIGMGSSEFHVIRADKKLLLADFLFVFLNRDEVRRIAAENMTGSSGHRRVPESFYAELKIPIPELKIQKKLFLNAKRLSRKLKTPSHKLKALGKHLRTYSQRLNTWKP